LHHETDNSKGSQGIHGKVGPQGWQRQKPAQSSHKRAGAPGRHGPMEQTGRKEIRSNRENVKTKARQRVNAGGPQPKAFA
jgi:hypothetical protein